MRNGHFALPTCGFHDCGDSAYRYFGPVDDWEGLLVVTLQITLAIVAYFAQWRILKSLA